MTYTHPFEPFIDKNSKILILGTFPSIRSFEKSFYYSHLKNQSWRLMSGVFEEEMPKSIEEKKFFLQKHHIALWDMIKNCKRKNSSDNNLKDIQINDIALLLQQFPHIRKIFFTSKTALKLFNKYCKNISLPTFYLPSPSPAYAVVSIEKKLIEYKKLLIN